LLHLFSLQPDLVLCDLASTYFEGVVPALACSAAVAFSDRATVSVGAGAKQQRFCRF
jgi:hypothetical protein